MKTFGELYAVSAQLAVLFMNVEDYASAERYIDRTIAIASHAQSGYICKVDLLLKTNRFQEAISLIRTFNQQFDVGTVDWMEALPQHEQFFADNFQLSDGS